MTNEADKTDPKAEAPKTKRGIRGNSPVLLAIGGGVSALFLAVIAWGQLKPNVVVPRDGVWSGEMPICTGKGVNRVALTEAVTFWKDRGYLVALLPAGSPCESRDGLVTFEVDPTIDERASVEEETYHEGKTTKRVDQGFVMRADIDVLGTSGAVTYAHEIGHALGYAHPVACPSGHVMHPSRAGWDGRGLKGP